MIHLLYLVGIIDIAMTFGEGERYSFQSRQEFFKSTQKRYFEMVNYYFLI